MECGVNVRIQSEYGKMRTRKTPNKDIFHAMDAIEEINTNTARALCQHEKSFNQNIKQMVRIIF